MSSRTVQSTISTSNTFAGVFLQGSQNTFKIDDLREAITNYVERINVLEETIGQLPEIEQLVDAVTDCTNTFTPDFITQLQTVVTEHTAQFALAIEKLGELSDDLRELKDTVMPESNTNSILYKLRDLRRVVGYGDGSDKPLVTRVGLLERAYDEMNNTVTKLTNYVKHICEQYNKHAHVALDVPPDSFVTFYDNFE